MAFYTSLAAYYERIFPFREPTYAFLRRYLPDAGAMLDVGCGSGHYCGRLQADGLRGVGIDRDAEMVAAARRNYPAAAFRRLAMEEIGDLLPIPDDEVAPVVADAAEAMVDGIGPLAGAYCIGNVAAHLPPAGWPRFLADLGRLLRPGAPWIVQTVNFDAILQQTSFCFPELSFDEGKVLFAREYREISAEGLRFSTRLSAAGEVLSAGEVTLYPLPAARCLQHHEAAGFTCRGHYADFREKPFDPTVFSGSVFVFERNIEGS